MKRSTRIATKQKYGQIFDISNYMAIKGLKRQQKNGINAHGTLKIAPRNPKNDFNISLNEIFGISIKLLIR